MPKGTQTAEDVFEVVDELPMASSGPRSVAAAVADRLRAEAPGKWVKVRVGSHSHTSFVNALRKQGVEAVTRTADGSKAVYARWAMASGDATTPVRRRSGHAAANDRAADAVLALVQREQPAPPAVEPAPQPAPQPTTAKASTGEDRLQRLRAAVRSLPMARRHGFRLNDIVDEIPEDVLAGSPRPGRLDDIAADPKLHVRVMAWLAEEAVA